MSIPYSGKYVRPFVTLGDGCVVPNITATQKAECVILSNESLRQLRSIEHYGSQFIITLDES
jgi:phosphotransacetylase